MDLSGSQWISFFTLSTLWLIYPIPKTAWDPCSDHFGTLFGLSLDHVMTPDTECSDWVQTKDPHILVRLCSDSVKTTVLRPCLDCVWNVFGRSSEMDLSGSQWISFFTLSTLWLIYPIPKTAWDPRSDHFGTLFGLSSDPVITPDTECSDWVQTKDPQILVETVFGPC